jgi:hypothetical protein
MSNYNAQAVIAALKANGGMYIDDHGRGNKEATRAGWFGVYKEQGKDHAFIGFNTQLFCVNKCYIAEDGQVHLSTWSVGGNVRMDLTPNDHEYAIEQFNETCRKYNTFDRLARISEFHVNAVAA